MNNENFFKQLSKSIPDYRKIVLLVFLIKNDDDLLKDVGFSKNDINRLSSEIKSILYDQLKDYLDFFANKEEIIIERLLIK